MKSLLQDREPYFTLRIAVRSVESWLLADVEAFAKRFSVRQGSIQDSIEQVSDPKALVMQLLSSSRSTTVQSQMLPRGGSARKVGPRYSASLIDFIDGAWSIERTISTGRVPSLERAVRSVKATINRYRDLMGLP